MLTPPVVQFFVLLATATLLAGCLSSPPREQHLAYGSQAGAPAERLRLVRIADAQIGSPYVYGGNRPGGFDCSGLVQFSHARAGISVPRTTTEQWRTATPLERSYLLPGDILFSALEVESLGMSGSTRAMADSFTPRHPAKPCRAPR